MNLVCLDLEGVLIPEIWVTFARERGIPELERSTREEPGFDKLMKYRLSILKEHGLTIHDITETISKMEPMEGAKDFLDELRDMTEVILVSDTFRQFVSPLMKKLGRPVIFCNELVIAENGEITDYKMRIGESKLTAVKALQSIGFETIAAGDSYNDLDMIKASKAGFLFRSTDKIKAEHPELQCFTEYHDLLSAIKNAM